MAEDREHLKISRIAFSRIASGRAVVVTLSLLLLSVAVTVGAQSGEDGTPPPATRTIGPEELNAFAVAYLEVSVLQQQLLVQVDELLAGSDLDPRRFREINRALNERGATADDANASDGEMSMYQTVLDDVNDLKATIHEQIIGVVRSENLSVDRFNEIIDAVQSDPDIAAAAEARIEAVIASREDLASTRPDDSEHDESR